MNSELLNEMKKKTENGTIPCSVARELAEKLGLAYGEVGAAADELGIKIKDCQLGCF